MKYQVLLMVVLVLCTLGLAGYIHSKRKEELKLTKHASFQNVKHRVTKDVLKEYQNHLAETTALLDSAKKQVEDLKAEVTTGQMASDTKKAEADTCTGDLKRVTDEVAAIDTERNNADDEFQKKKTSLQEQINGLKKEMGQRSKVCDYIKKDSVDGQKLCGITESLGNKTEAENEKKVETKAEKDDTKEEKKEEKKEADKTT